MIYEGFWRGSETVEKKLEGYVRCEEPKIPESVVEALLKRFGYPKTRIPVVFAKWIERKL